MVFINGKIITPERILENHVLVTDGIRIKDIVPKSVRLRLKLSETINLKGWYLSPGFIDIHFHGLHHHSCSEARSLPEILKRLPAYGTTGCLPSIASVTLAQYREWLKSIKKIGAASGSGAMMLGVHLEGPYISKECRGGMREDLVWNPKPQEYKCLIEQNAEVIKMMTLSPELPGALDLIKFLVRHKIVVSAGHSLASYNRMQKAVSAGLKNVCHIFNNTAIGYLHKEPGVRRPCIDEIAFFFDRIFTEVITDGIHVDPVYLKLLRRLKGPEKVILITDANQGAGLPEGSYRMSDGRRFRIRSNEAARLSDGSLAGSSLTLNRAVRNYVKFTGAGIAEAVRAASLNPADLLGLSEKMGSIEKGKEVNLTVLDEDFNVHLTYVKGKKVYDASRPDSV